MTSPSNREFRTSCLLFYMSTVGSVGDRLLISLGLTMTRLPFEMSIAVTGTVNESHLSPVACAQL